MSDRATVTPISSIGARITTQDWPWAREQRGRIDEHWQRLVEANPALFDGRVLVRRSQSLRKGHLSLDYSETDYSAFLAFRDWGFPDPAAGNGFAMAALRSEDGAYLLGLMGDHTANAGLAYFPAGTPDPGDVLADGTVDLAGSVLRELAEETGLAGDDVDVTDRWTAVFAGARTAMMREVRFRGSASEARDRVRAFLATEREPELSDLCIVRGIADIEARTMPLFMQAFLHDAFDRR